MRVGGRRAELELDLTEGDGGREGIAVGEHDLHEIVDDLAEADSLRVVEEHRRPVGHQGGDLRHRRTPGERVHEIERRVGRRFRTASDVVLVAREDLVVAIATGELHGPALRIAVPEACTSARDA